MPTPAALAAASRSSFLDTHRWITFRLDLSRLDREFWTLLGESRSKCRHLRNTPMKPGVADELRAVYLAKGAHATTAIEGNTLTEDEARKRIAGELPLPPSLEYLGQEIDNVVQAIDRLEQHLMSTGGEFHLTIPMLREFNLIILSDVPVDDGVVPGRLRRNIVGVGNYRAPEPSEVDLLLRLMCDWLNGDDFAVVAGEPRETFFRAFAKAVVAHVYLAWIHPFGDGNGRIARLIEFGVLTEAGLPSVAAHLLSNFYNQTRPMYYRELEKASASGGDLTSFFLYAMRGFVDQLQLAINRLHEENLQVAWENFVHEAFELQHGKTAKRQRDLVLALSHVGGPVRRVDLRGLTPALAEAYAGSSQKMLTRDLNSLARMNLIARVPEGIRARTERMFDFLPDIATDGALD